MYKKSTVEKLIDKTNHFIFRLGRKFDKRKFDFETLLPENKTFNDHKDLQIIIPIFGESHLIGKCLDSIRESIGINPKVIVVDNGVPKEIRELVKGYEFLEHYIENKENKGFGGACNIGIEKVTSEFVVLLNSDIILKKDTLRILLETIECQPKVGICASTLVDEYGRYEEVGRVLTQEGNSIAIDGTRKIKQLNNVGISVVPYASFACVALRKEVFDKAHGFDPVFWPAYSEDLDLAIKFYDLGFVSVVSHESFAFHKQGSSTKELVDLQSIKEKNRKTLLAKHQEFFDKVPHINHDETRYFRTLRAKNYPRKSILVLSGDNKMDLQSLSELLNCKLESLVIKAISIIKVDSKILPIKLNSGVETECKNYGIDVYDPGKDSIKQWFRDRIFLFDEVVLSNVDPSFNSSEIFELVKESQPEVGL